MTQSPDSFQFRTEDAERSSSSRCSSASSGSPDVQFVDEAGEGREHPGDTTITFDVEDAPAPSQATAEQHGSPAPQPPPSKTSHAASPTVAAGTEPLGHPLPPVAPSRPSTCVVPAAAATAGSRDSPDASPAFRAQLSRHSEGSICFEDQPLSQTQLSTPLQAPHDLSDDVRGAVSSPELAAPITNDPAPGHESSTTAEELMNIDSDPPTSKKSGSPRKPLKLAQHPTEWVSRTVASPHHALYQPARVKELDEDAFVKQHPFWNRPKGASASKCSSSADGEGTQPQQGFPTIPSPLDVRNRVRSYMDTVKKPRPTDSRKAAPAATTAPTEREAGNENARSQPAAAEAASRPITAVAPNKQSPGATGTDARVQQWLHLQPPSGGGSVLPAANSADHSNDIKVSPRSDDGGCAIKDGGTVPQKANEPSDTLRQASSASQRQLPQQPQKSHRASSATRKPTASTDTHTAALEAKRRQLVLLYGSRRGLELFAKFKENCERDRAAVGSEPKGAPPTLSKHTPRVSDEAAVARAAPAPKRNSSLVKDEPLREDGGGHGRTDASTPRDRETVWDRLYTAHIRHPGHSPSRDQTTSFAEVKANRSASADSGKGARDGPGTLSPRQAANHDEIFAKLYRCGMDELSKRKKLFQEGQYKKLEREMTESLEAVIAARIMRRPDGHKPMTRGEMEATVASEKAKFLERLRASYDAAVKKNVDDANESGKSGDDGNSGARLTPRRVDALPTAVPLLSFSPELRLTRDEIDDLSSRLYRHKVRKFAEEEKLKEHLELAQCTFRPAINRYRSASPTSATGSARPSTGANTADSAAAAEPSNEQQRSSRSSSANRCLALYSYAKRDQKSQMVLKERLQEKRKADILQSKLDSDHHFRRRVASDPSLAKKFMDSLRV